VAKGALDLAIRNADIDLVQKTLGNPEDGKALSHKLVRYVNKRDKDDHPVYSEGYVLFASNYVEEELPKQEDIHRFKQLGRMVQHLAAIGHAAVLRGHFYEHFAHVALCRGRKVVCRSLEAKKTSENIIFSELAEEAVEGLAGLVAALPAAGPDAYFQLSLRQANFPAADAVAIVNKQPMLLQMTCAASHPLPLKGLYDLIRALASQWPKLKSFRVCFVLPTQTRFDNFKKQPIPFKTRGEGVTEAAMRQLIDEKVEQWALLLNTDE